jgi:hypothetical protein
MDTAFASALQKRVDALLVSPDPLFLTRRGPILTLAAHHRLPASYPLREFTEAGGLMSYGASNVDQYRQAGLYAGRILKGEKPASYWNIDPLITASLLPSSSVAYDPTQVYPYTLTIKTTHFGTQVMNGPNANPEILLGVQSQSLSYSNFGLWEQGNFPAQVVAAGAYGAGIPTDPGHLPKKKEESYVGTILFEGLFASSPGNICHHCVGPVSMTIDFGNSTIVYSISFGSGWGTLTGTGTLSGNTFSSSLSGSLNVFGHNVAVAGALSGLIYGPSGTEIAGSYGAFGILDTCNPSPCPSATGVQGAFGAQIPKQQQ